MVDFAKLKYKMKSDRTYVTYQCEECGEVDEYVTEMPSGWKHSVTRAGRRCSGLLLEVSRRTVPR